MYVYVYVCVHLLRLLIKKNNNYKNTYIYIYTSLIRGLSERTMAFAAAGSVDKSLQYIYPRSLKSGLSLSSVARDNTCCTKSYILCIYLCFLFMYCVYTLYIVCVYVCLCLCLCLCLFLFVLRFYICKRVL